MLLYYITDRLQFSGNEQARQSALLQKIAEAAACGVDLIQLREKDLSARALEILTGNAVNVVRENSAKTRLLINSRCDVALACGADGVHLRSDDISPRDVFDLWRRTGATSAPAVGVSCHTIEDVVQAASQGATLAVFAPVFEKEQRPPIRPAGLEQLRQACREKIPVLALGGVTLENARLCLEAGAAGVAGIRLFQQNDIARIARTLRS